MPLGPRTRAVVEPLQREDDRTSERPGGPKPPALQPPTSAQKPNATSTQTAGATVSPERRALARAALALETSALLAQCELSFFVASGPGGQHRNKTESGVRLTHPPTGMSVTATERRSQLQNRGVALERLLEGLRALTVVPKQRRATKPTRGSKERRIEGKKKQSEKKANRRGDW